MWEKWVEGEENLQGLLIVARLGAVLSFLSCLLGIERRPLLCLPCGVAGVVEVLWLNVLRVGRGLRDRGTGVSLLLFANGSHLQRLKSLPLQSLPREPSHNPRFPLALHRVLGGRIPLADLFSRTFLEPVFWLREPAAIWVFAGL